jgi:hypothetical protein
MQTKKEPRRTNHRTSLFERRRRMICMFCRSLFFATTARVEHQKQQHSNGWFVLERRRRFFVPKNDKALYRQRDRMCRLSPSLLRQEESGKIARPGKSTSESHHDNTRGLTLSPWPVADPCDTSYCQPQRCCCCYDTYMDPQHYRRRRRLLPTHANFPPDHIAPVVVCAKRVLL